MELSNRRGFIAAFFALIALFVVACGPPSAADMEKAWHTNEENAQKYAAKYPGFKDAINDLLTKTKAEFEEAKKADEKSRGEKMKVAVDKVSSSIAPFATYETEVDKLNKLMTDKDILDMPASKVNPALDASKEAIKKADDTLKNGKFANMGEGKAKLEEAIKAIQDASKRLQDLKPAKASGGNTSSPGSTSTSQSTASPGSTSSP